MQSTIKTIHGKNVKIIAGSSSFFWFVLKYVQLAGSEKW